MGCRLWGCKELDTTERLTLHSRLGLSQWLSDKEPTCQCRRRGLNPWVGKTPWRRDGDPLQYSCLENPSERGAWWAAIHSVAKSQRRLKQLRCKHILHCSHHSWALTIAASISGHWLPQALACHPCHSWLRAVGPQSCHHRLIQGFELHSWSATK